MAETLLTVEHLIKKYGDQVILDDVSLDVKKGEVIVVVGPMATVGDRTREQEKLLLEDPLAERVVLEWNPGGHFADSGKRLAKGIRWLLEKKK